MVDPYKNIAGFAIAGLFMLVCMIGTAQIIPAQRTTDWSRAGFHLDIPEPQQVLNIVDLGAIGDGQTPTGPALALAFAAAQGQMTVIQFPPGDFLFTQGILVPDSVVLRGAGSDQTTLTFSLGGTGHCINLVGQETVDEYPLAQDLPRGATSVSFTIPFPFQNGDLLRFYRPDEDLVVSPWAIGTTGQLVHVEQAGDATILLASPLRAPYPSIGSYVRKIDPRMYSGIECLRIVRTDETVEQFSNIWFNKASHCWVRGVESDKANFAHIELFESTNCEISGNYLHHGFSYGTGGKAYGVNLFHTSGENLVENNIFEHLRHSMIVHIGANGNVLAYNFSTDPFWTQGGLPANSAGDLVLHGDHPYLNLFEGNIVQNIVIDDSHGINGPFNTLFRDRASTYGFFMNNAPPTDSLNIVGNEIDGTFFLIQGTGHFMHGNSHQGNTIPQGTEILPDTSYYLDSLPTFLTPIGNLPQIGPQALAPGTIPAQIRFLGSAPRTICTEDDISTSITSHKTDMRVFPNPFNERIVIDAANIRQITLMDMIGRTVLDQRPLGTPAIVEVGIIPSAPYLLLVTDAQGRTWRSVMIRE